MQLQPNQAASARQQAAAQARQRAAVAAREQVRRQSSEQVRQQALAQVRRQAANEAQRRAAEVTRQQRIDQARQQAVQMARQRAAEQARGMASSLTKNAGPVSGNSNAALVSRTVFNSEVGSASNSQTAALRSTAPGQVSAPRKEPIQLKKQQANGSTGSLNRNQGDVLVNRLQNSSDPRDRQLLNNVMLRRTLSEAERVRAQELVQANVRRNPADRTFANAMALSLRDDRLLRDRERVNLLVANQSRGRFVPGYLAPYPWYRSGFFLNSYYGPGSYFLATLGINPYYPSAFFPLLGRGYGGRGFVAQIDPCAGYDDGGWLLNTVDGLPPDGTAPPSSEPAPVFRATRYLRVANALQEKVKVHVQYRTLTDKGELVWYPTDPGTSDQALTCELAPGEVVDLYDGKWRLNAQAVRVWAESDSTQWIKFKTEDLWLVPEQDDQGAHGYLAPQMQTFTLAIR